MEIGISTDQIIDVGLNLAGFIIAGLILMLIKSLFSRKKDSVRETATPQPIIDSSEDNLISEQIKEKTDSNIEYVNLGGVDWKPQRNTRKYNSPVNSKSRKRQNVIRLAREMMTEKKINKESPAVLPITDGEHSLSERDLKAQAAGRN